MIYMISREGNDEQVEATPVSATEDGYSEADMQKWILTVPDMLDQGLLIIDNEYSGFDRSGSRVDILGFDADGKLIIMELKQGTASRAELQALEYAAMCSTLTLSDLATIYAQSELRDVELSPEQAEEVLREHLSDPESFQDLDDEPRVLLIANDFSPELTSTALWLNDRGLDISCIRLRAHEVGDQWAMTVENLIPLPEAEEYMVKAGEKKRETRRRKPPYPLLQAVERLWRAEEYELETRLTQRYLQFLLPDVRGVHFELEVRRGYVEVGLHFERSDQGFNHKAAELVLAHREQIETRSGFKTRLAVL